MNLIDLVALTHVTLDHPIFIGSVFDERGNWNESMSVDACDDFNRASIEGYVLDTGFLRCP